MTNDGVANPMPEKARGEIREQSKAERDELATLRKALNDEVRANAALRAELAAQKRCADKRVAEIGADVAASRKSTRTLETLRGERVRLALRSKELRARTAELMTKLQELSRVIEAQLRPPPSTIDTVDEPKDQTSTRSSEG
jgi:prefoldin subunit 5